MASTQRFANDWDAVVDRLGGTRLFGPIGFSLDARGTTSIVEDALNRRSGACSDPGRTAAQACQSVAVRDRVGVVAGLRVVG